MNREIKFRGISYESNKFVYGWLLQNKYNTSKYFIRTFTNEDDDYNDVVVDINTVGQYTNLKDKNGVKIFEGDIVKYTFVLEFINGYRVYTSNTLVEYNVEFGKYILSLKDGDYYSFCEIDLNDELEVIGNIYENKELLKNE